MKDVKEKGATTYYDMDYDFAGGSPGWKFLNNDTLQKDHKGITPVPPWPNGVTTSPNAGPWRFPDFVEKPRFLFDKKFGRAPRDLENIDGFWMVSAPMKAVLEATDPEACEFRACETVLRSGRPGPERWLCAVTRAFFDSVDLKATEGLTVGRYPNGATNYMKTVLTKLRFNPEVVGTAHLFHAVEISSRLVYCDQVIKDACEAAGVMGVRFCDTANP
jgi:hypothetical protein